MPQHHHADIVDLKSLTETRVWLSSLTEFTPRYGVNGIALSLLFEPKYFDRLSKTGRFL